MKVLVAVAASLALATVAKVANAQLQPKAQPQSVRAAVPALRAPPKPMIPEAELSYLAPENVPELPDSPKHYRGPEGFSGHNWGDVLGSFDRLPYEAAAVRAAFTYGAIAPEEYVCRSTASASGSSLIVYGAPGAGVAGYQCSIDDVLRNAHPRGKAGGFHVLSEYLIEGQGFRFSKVGVLMYPVVYDFCAHWEGWNPKKPKVPANIDGLNRFCGMRLLFETEALSQLRELPEDHVTRYDLVLAELIANYGKPAGFSRRGRVNVEPLGEQPAPAAKVDRKFSEYRWCPAPYLGLEAHCDVSIILTLDPELGRGIVLFATPALWQYAFARENGFSRPDALYTLLHALSPKKRLEIPTMRVAVSPASGNPVNADHSAMPAAIQPVQTQPDSNVDVYRE